ncbi:response regulator transcription factor [Streptomyces sp. DT224]|uniref:response regulator transcription factor n=1 Tax=Streptomyces sp. DT224 TaxID=3393426 RepID=UPI003CF3D959
MNDCTHDVRGRAAGASGPETAGRVIRRRLRVVLAEDSVVLRDGMVELLGARGCEVVATAGTAPGLIDAVAEHRPDVAVVDIRMPPTQTDEGVPLSVSAGPRGAEPCGGGAGICGGGDEEPLRTVAAPAH